jgi:hypothetical protein
MTTALMLQNTLQGPSIGTPITISLYCSPSIILIAILIATKSDPNVGYLTVFCLFECHNSGALFTKIITPVCNLLVTWPPVRSASTKHEYITALVCKPKVVHI